VLAEEEVAEIDPHALRRTPSASMGQTKVSNN
jgi:hypothetical protein